MKVDIDKIVALRKAGWGTDRIAEEMHMDPEDVDRMISDNMEHEQKQKDIPPEEVVSEIPEVNPIIALTFAQLTQIYEKAAAIGAKEALKTFEQERKKEYSGRSDRRIRNTKLLLRNYHMLKEHADKSVFGRTQMEESAMDILESMMTMYDNEVIIESIKRSATRTAVIVSHIDTMFGLYAAYCDRSHTKDIDIRRYDVVWDMYMAEPTLSVKEIAEKYHMSKGNVYADLNVAIERLTALIFGVDGLKVH